MFTSQVFPSFVLSVIFGIMGVCTVYNYDLLRVLRVHITMHALVANAISNPWTASKSDCTTKIIVTLLFNDGFPKCKNHVKGDGLLKKKSTICVISSNVYFLNKTKQTNKQKSRNRGPFFLTHPISYVDKAPTYLDEIFNNEDSRDLDDFLDWSVTNQLKLYPTKCQTLQICFMRDLPPHQTLKLVRLCWLLLALFWLQMTLNGTPMWTKWRKNAVKHLFLLRSLKRFGFWVGNRVRNTTWYNKIQSIG